MRSKRTIVTGVTVAVLTGVGSGLWSARELRQEPPVGTWLDSQGRPVLDGTDRDDGFPLVLHLFHGIEHCDWQDVTFLHVSWPLGTVVRSPYRDGYRQYIRDPERKLLPAFRLEPFVSDIPLPGDARATGYHRAGWELWVSPSHVDRYVYLVHGDRAERWPRAGLDVACK